MTNGRSPRLGKDTGQVSNVPQNSQAGQTLGGGEEAPGPLFAVGSYTMPMLH